MIANGSWDDDDEMDYIQIGDPSASLADPAEVENDDPSPTVTFTAANPQGSVAATANLGGRIQRVDLTARAMDMTEAELAEEIVVIAGLASEKSQAAQHAVAVELMRSMGHDRVSTSGYLEYTVGLPSPNTAEARAAEIFATRYARDSD
ncbi:YbaB/EbfC family DNA-binding protein [Mycobacterium hodleri]|uniref:YbaB/EbfC family DNA-binding protein n=1 Tax=Mycolicibacterium hodleri TaxID=49897 RepID=A0A544VWW1_9MYCO|nr:YbaB/EbfC family DNA-binding protein [Mycolicibacterium hodleri]TQR84468.1 YbaB/EbfC family DNA-binding protein [Mycolicibacterium hodleri]